MAENPFQRATGFVNDLLTDEKYKDFRTLGAGLGQVALSDNLANTLRGLSDTAANTLGTYEDQIEKDMAFKPFSVTGGPGQVQVDATGNVNYTTDSPYADLQDNLTGGVSDFYNKIFGKQVDPVTGAVSYNPSSDRNALMNLIQGRSGEGQPSMLQTLQSQYGDGVSLTDPFTADNRAAREQDIFNRLTEIRRPEEERAQMALQEQLLNQGRLGLQTAAYGGSPEQLALEKAIQEQRAADGLQAINAARSEAMDLTNARQAAMGQATQDSQLYSDQVLQGLGREIQQKQAGADIASNALRDSLLPTESLAGLSNLGLNVADLNAVQGRQLGSSRASLVNTLLDYDLGTEEQAATLRNNSLQGLLNLLANAGASDSQSNTLTGATGNAFAQALEALAKENALKAAGAFDSSASVAADTNRILNQNY